MIENVIDKVAPQGSRRRNLAISACNRFPFINKICLLFWNAFLFIDAKIIAVLSIPKTLDFKLCNKLALTLHRTDLIPEKSKKSSTGFDYIRTSRTGRFLPFRIMFKSDTIVLFFAALLIPIPPESHSKSSVNDKPKITKAEQKKEREKEFISTQVLPTTTIETIIQQPKQQQQQQMSKRQKRKLRQKYN